MSFPALDTLVRVLPADAGRLLDRLHALAIHDGSARIRVTAHALPFRSMHRSIQQVPGTVETEPPEMVKHRLPGRKVAGKVAPVSASAQDVEDGVKDAT
jgi:hypothetical protein